MLDGRQVLLNLSASELQRIPIDEPFVAIANRQQPAIDEFILAKIFKPITPHFRILTTKDLKISYKERYEQLRSVKLSLRSPILQFDQLDMLSTSLANQHSLGICIDYFDDTFWNLPRRQSLKSLFKIIKTLQVPIVPIHLEYDPNLCNPELKLQVRIGQPISVQMQKQFTAIDRFRKFVQTKIYALGSALEVQKFYLPQQAAADQQVPLIDPIPQHLLEQDIQYLKFQNLLSAQGDFDVFIAKATDIPNIIKEIGRLREKTFRAVGEGTGKCYDLDEFDLYYEQLFIWDRVAKRLVGGYRLGRGDDIFHTYGVEGFYIYSLFKIRHPFFKVMQQSVELGRSFVIETYQKKRLPLYLLWRGILFFLLRHPQYRYLYGPLSISKYYSQVSKSIIVAFIRKFYFDHHLAQYLRPRKPFQLKLERLDIDVLLDQFKGNLGNLDQFIEDIEPQHFRIPILMKQYIRQNARFISFNVDPNFSDALDGFMILDLNDVPYTTIQALQKESSCNK